MKSTHIPAVQAEPILSIVCKDDDVEVERKVYELPLTEENLKIFWEKVKEHKAIFNTEIRGDFKKFVKIFLREERDGTASSNGLFWVVDDFVGVMYITNIYPMVDALAHVSFFDKRTNERVVLAKAMLRYVFDTYQFHRLW